MASFQCYVSLPEGKRPINRLFAPPQEDLEKALQLDPLNSEVRQQLQQLRDQLRQERTATRQAQRQTAGFRKIFAGPALYDTEKPKPILREMKGKELRDGMRWMRRLLNVSDILYIFIGNGDEWDEEC